MKKTKKKQQKTLHFLRKSFLQRKPKKHKQFQWLLYITVAISIVFSVAAFMLLPYALASLLRKVGVSEFGVTVAEAFVKLALFPGIYVSDFQNERYSENIYVPRCRA